MTKKKGTIIVDGEIGQDQGDGDNMSKNKGNLIQRLFNRPVPPLEKHGGHTRPTRPLHLMPKIQVILPASPDARDPDARDKENAGQTLSASNAYTERIYGYG